MEVYRIQWKFKGVKSGPHAPFILGVHLQTNDLPLLFIQVVLLLLNLLPSVFNLLNVEGRSVLKIYL